MGYLEDGPDSSERLATLRPEHLAYLRVDPAVVVLGAEITNRRIRRGTFTSVAALKRAITAYVNDHNENASPFIWTKSARTIVRKINKCHAIYGGSH